MTALLDHIAAAGYPLSMLYPATVPIYRSLGWELAGVNYAAEINARSLHTITAAADRGAAARRVRLAAGPEAREQGAEESFRARRGARRRA